MPDTPALPPRRLKKRAQFLRAARGTKVARRGFVLQAVKVGATSPGIGYTVTKKTGNAPERNRIKRRLRAAIAQMSDKLVTDNDYVLIGRREALNEPFDALVGALSGAIAHMNRKMAPKGQAGVEESHE